MSRRRASPKKKSPAGSKSVIEPAAPASQAPSEPSPPGPSESASAATGERQAADAPLPLAGHAAVVAMFALAFGAAAATVYWAHPERAGVVVFVALLLTLLIALATLADALLDRQPDGGDDD